MDVFFFSLLKGLIELSSVLRCGDVEEHVVGFQSLRAAVPFCFVRLEIADPYIRYRRDC